MEKKENWLNQALSVVSYAEFCPLQHIKSLEESSRNKMRKIYYSYGDPMFNMKTRLKHENVIYEFFSCSSNIPRGLSAYKP